MHTQIQIQTNKHDSQSYSTTLQFHERKENGKRRRILFKLTFLIVRSHSNSLFGIPNHDDSIICYFGLYVRQKFTEVTAKHVKRYFNYNNHHTNSVEILQVIFLSSSETNDKSLYDCK